MTSRLPGLVVALVLSGSMACMTSSPAARASPGAPRKPMAYCQMALSALEAVVKRYSEQPLGLERSCVEEGTVDGRVYVDARFTKNDKLEEIVDSSCTTDRFVVRFDPRTFVPAPNRDVVLLMLWTDKPAIWEFNARIEVSNWPSHRPGVMTLSPCGSAYGVLRQTNERWGATVVPPPRSPDAL